MTEPFDAVLAEMPDCCAWNRIPQDEYEDLKRWIDRLAAAHARDQRHYAEIERTWEWHKQTTIRAMTRAEVAEALLREALPYVATDDPGERAEVIALRTRIAAHLSGATD